MTAKEIYQTVVKWRQQITTANLDSSVKCRTASKALEKSTEMINQSIKIYFLSNRNITVYTVYTSAQKAVREAYAH